MGRNPALVKILINLYMIRVKSFQRTIEKAFSYRYAGTALVGKLFERRVYNDCSQGHFCSLSALAAMSVRSRAWSRCPADPVRMAVISAGAGNDCDPGPSCWTGRWAAIRGNRKARRHIQRG